MGAYLDADELPIPTDLQAYLEIAGSDVTVNAAIARVEGQVNGYISGSYELPLSKVYRTPALQVACVDMVLYRLYLGKDQYPPEPITRQNDLAVEWLKEAGDPNKGTTLGEETKLDAKPSISTIKVSRS